MYIQRPFKFEIGANIPEIYQLLKQEDIVDITNISKIDENSMSYDLNWYDPSVNAHIMQTILEDGSTKLEIKEADLHDVVIITANGQNFLNGFQVSVASVEKQKSITPRAGTVEYSKDPFWGNKDDYDDPTGEREYSINTGQEVASSTISGLVAIIGSGIVGVGIAITIASIVLGIQRAYLSANPRGETLYYTIAGYENPYAPSGGMVFYNKQVIKWFTDSYFSNEVREARETNFSKTTIRDV